MAAGLPGGISQMLHQAAADGHLVGIGRVPGKGAQHAGQDFAALLVQTGVLRGSSWRHGLWGGDYAENWWLGYEHHDGLIGQAARFINAIGEPRRYGLRSTYDPANPLEPRAYGPEL